jgi:integrase
LESITLRESVDWYMEHRIEDTSTATRRKHRSALGIFVDWTDDVGLDDTNELTGRDLMRFKTWRKRESNVEKISLNGTLAILRRFLVFCETIDAVHPGLVDRVPMPNVSEDDEVCTVVPTDEEIAGIREYHGKYEYASRRHAVFELIAEVGLRLGAVRAIDLPDCDLEDGRIYLRHRPEGVEEYGTPLKNGHNGERIVNISPRTCDLLADYVSDKRDEVVDEYGREPLFSTPSGRAATATIRRDFYKMSRPCTYADGCPHDRSIDKCEATKNAKASDCPSRFSTHPVRKWSVMRQLDAGVPKEILSDRVDVSVPVLEKHYDQRSEERKQERRRDVLEDCLDEYRTLDET